VAGISATENVTRRIHLARWSDNNTTTGGYGPIPAINTGVEDFSVAFAFDALPANAKRFYWMSRRAQGQTPRLFTLRRGEAGSASEEVAVTLADCSSPGAVEDYQPWITPEGTLLLLTASCEAGPPTLWVARPAADGTLSPAQQLNVTGALDTDSFSGGSLSPDKCEIWFARGGDIYSASRNLAPPATPARDPPSDRAPYHPITPRQRPSAP
jgi:hypothetical protein